MKYFLTLFILIAVFANTALAQVDSAQFNFRVFAGLDNSAPSTPTLLSATPISSNQIDIAWTAAVDNFSVAGYSVLRDSVAIATTTLLSYQDTSLSASTTYSYEVVAFDSSYNYSSTSNSLATTTPDNPPPPVVATSTDNTSQSTATRVIISDFRIETGLSTTSIFLATQRPSRFELRWGRTSSYELGYVVTNAFSTTHNINLFDLEPGTTYDYEIVGYSPSGFSSVVRNGTFTTLSNFENFQPTNVNKFVAVRNGTDVNLSWQLPTNQQIEKVRIVRSHLGFPESSSDGAVVYQGLGSSFTDVDILSQYSPVYYTAFVYDQFGNVSSGAIAIAYALAEAGVIPDEVYEGEETVIQLPEFSDEATSTVNPERVLPGMKMPELADILLIQNNKTFSLEDTNISLDSRAAILISLDSSAVAKNLKSIIVSIVDPTNNKNVYSYLLKINKNQTAYQALIEPFMVIGDSSLVLEIYDYEAFVVATYQAPITFVDNEREVKSPMSLATPLKCLPFVILFILFGLLIFIYKKKTEDKER